MDVRQMTNGKKWHYTDESYYDKDDKVVSTFYCIYDPNGKYIDVVAHEWLARLIMDALNVG